MKKIYPYSLVADYFIAYAHRTESFMSNQKLNKLVYYAQAWTMALLDRELIKEDFQARVHGLSKYDSDYFLQVLKRIKDLSEWTKQELISNRSLALRAHPIEWKFTSEPTGFNFPLQKDVANAPYQFAISANQHGRIHGFFPKNTFYIV